MDQPLWQNLFNIALVGFVVRRAALGIGLAEHVPPALYVAYVGLCAVCALAGILLWFSRRWVIAGLIAVGVAFTITTFAEIAVGAIAPPPLLLIQWIFGSAGCVALVVLALRTPPESGAHECS
jgi:hypothetical protein